MVERWLENGVEVVGGGDLFMGVWDGVVWV